MSTARSLLFISPVMPAATGNGLAMRAGVFLDALSADHEVSLLVVPVSGPVTATALPEFVVRRAARVVVVPLEGRADPLFRLITRLKDPGEQRAALSAYPKPVACRFATSETVSHAAGCFAGTRFDFIHVFRLYMVPFAMPWLRAGGENAHLMSVLDLDDDEPRTHQRLSALHSRRGEVEAAGLEASESDKYRRLERELLPHFDRILVCTVADRAELRHRLRVGVVEVIPNAVRMPARVEEVCDHREGEAFSLLFVGSLGYVPNADAVEFFCHEALPRLRASARCPVSVQIVGTDPGPGVLRLSEIPGVTVTGMVPSVDPYYAAADAVVVPIRAGGGTRIKVLEAFAHRVPVVSTSVGAEGLEVEDGKHLLIADAPDELASACLRLLRDPGLGKALAERASALLRSRYALSKVVARIRRLYSPP